MGRVGCEVKKWQIAAHEDKFFHGDDDAIDTLTVSCTATKEAIEGE